VEKAIKKFLNRPTSTSNPSLKNDVMPSGAIHRMEPDGCLNCPLPVHLNKEKQKFKGAATKKNSIKQDLKNWPIR
jgi:hypothetical protein